MLFVSCLLLSCVLLLVVVLLVELIELWFSNSVALLLLFSLGKWFCLLIVCCFVLLSWFGVACLVTCWLLLVTCSF